jgi:phage/conjugal plasmid C-4 type zinc finger TraR family protein
LNFSNSAFDLAELRTEQERDAAIASAAQALRGIGADECADCSRPIDLERRKALPSATRCMTCQTRFERKARRR